MFAQIKAYMSYVVFAVVMGLCVMNWIQSKSIDSLKADVSTQKTQIANQRNEIDSMKSDIAGLNSLEQGRKDSRSELKALSKKLDSLSENKAKENPGEAQAQLNELVNSLLKDIGEASK